MNDLKQLMRKAVFAISAAALLVAAFLPLLVQSASAVGQITTRSITMSTSAPSAAATYTLTFTPVTTSQELIVDFCSNSPLVGDTCSFASTTVPTIAAPTSNVGTATAVGSGSPVHTLKVTGLTMTAGTPFTINFTGGITNPSSATTFYGRILTFATGNASGYAPANTTGNTPTSGTYVDYGGDALSTANNISITAKVFETLSFCVFQTSCGTAPSLTLGDPTTGALSTSNAYLNSNAKYTLATNAGSGVSVVMRGNTLCRSATPANCVTGVNQYTISSMYTSNSNSATPHVLTTGIEQFGMCADKNSSTALTVATTYNDTVNNCNGLSTGIYAGTSIFGFDDNSSNGTNSSGGNQVLSSSAAVPSVTGTFAFLGDLGTTTEAGIYTTSLNLVATSTY